MSKKTPIAVPAGWYPDPADARIQRWWNGSEWTAGVHEADPAVTRGRHVGAELRLSITSFVGGRYPRHRLEVSAVA